MQEPHTAENHPFPNLYRLSKEKHGLFLGCPIWRQTEMEWHVSMTQLYALMFNLGLHFYDYPMIGDALIQRSRSRSASDFLKSDAQVFVQIDSDIAFNPIDVLKIAELTFTHDIVGGAYVKRMQEKTEIAIRTHVPTQIVFDQGSEPVEVEYLSGGFYAVHRNVLETLLETHDYELPLCHAKDMKFYPFFADKIHEIEGDKLFLSEDWAFFQRCKEAGFKCYVDPTVRLGHVGNYTYTLEDMARKPRPEIQGIRFTRHEGGKATLEGTGSNPQLPTEEIVTTADGFKMHIIPGDMMISESIRRSGYWDKEVRDVLCEKINEFVFRNDVYPIFLDLGAHFGYYSLLTASLGAKAIAVEPNPEMYNLLVKSKELNGFDIEPWFCAVSNFEGQMHLVTDGLQNNGESYISNSGGAYETKVFTLDSILKNRYPEIIKIDIEGEEGNVLYSASGAELMNRAKVMIVEISDQQLRRNSKIGAEELKALIRTSGFTLSLIKQHDTYADWLAVK